MSKKQDKRIAWTLFWFSNVGFTLCMVVWLLDLVSNRTIIGITLALSWLSLQYESWNGTRIAKD